MLVNWDMMQLAFKNPDQTPYAGKIFPAPMPGAKAGLSGSIEGHEYLAVPSPSRNKAAAKQFIKYLQTPEVQKKRALEDGQTPVLKALFKDADVKKVINLDVVFQAAANCYYRPGGARVHPVLGRHLHRGAERPGEQQGRAQGPAGRGGQVQQAVRLVR